MNSIQKSDEGEVTIVRRILTSLGLFLFTMMMFVFFKAFIGRRPPR